MGSFSPKLSMISVVVSAGRLWCFMDALKKANFLLAVLLKAGSKLS